MKGRETDLWQRQLAEKPPEEMVTTLLATGFRGIYLDRRAYAEPTLEQKLAYLLDQEPLRSKDGRLASPRSLLEAIRQFCVRARRPLLLFDSLEALSDRWGMRTASDFFGRCCPMLLDLGAIAYWSVPGARQYRTLHREIEQITQCIIVVSEGRLRIGKAEGRPPGVQGQMFHCSAHDGTLQRRAALVAQGEAHGHALAVILGVEDDHAALLHIGVDLGQRGFRQRPRIGQHRPVEHRKEGDLVVEDVDGERLAWLHRRALDQEPAETDQALAAHFVRRAVARKDIAEGDLGGRLDGAPSSTEMRGAAVARCA